MRVCVCLFSGCLCEHPVKGASFLFMEKRDTFGTRVGSQRNANSPELLSTRKPKLKCHIKQSDEISVSRPPKFLFEIPRTVLVLLKIARKLFIHRKRKIAWCYTYASPSQHAIGLGHSSRHCRSPFYHRPFDARDIHSLLSSFFPNSANERSLGYITLIVTRRVREGPLPLCGSIQNARAGQEASAQMRKREKVAADTGNGSVKRIKMPRGRVFFFRAEKCGSQSRG